MLKNANAMMGYKNLEANEGLVDVLPVDNYCNKVEHMQVAFEELVQRRPKIRGHDMALGYEARLWLLIVGSYSLLEQCLKLLVGIRTSGYLSPKKAPNTARDDGHDLCRVYDRLEGLDKGLLEESYAQYASFTEFPLPTLRSYLTVIGKHNDSMVWRYLLLEKDTSELRDLPSPLSLDMLLEAIRGTLDILEAKAWSDRGMHGIIRRLEQGLEDALCRGSDGLPPDGLNRWVPDGGGIVNAFSRYLRAGPLDDYTNAMREWLDHSVVVAKKVAKQDDDLARFLAVASRCCVTVNDNRFSFTNRRPEPLCADRSLDIHGGWSVEWRTGNATWCGAVDDFRTLPVRPGQTSWMTWHRCENRPTWKQLSPSTQGRLIVRRHGREVTSLEARILSVGGPKATLADRARFTVVGTDGDLPPEECDLACQDCRGTGFCMDCRGESTHLDCGACSRAEGLCPTCLGYGRDGDRIIAGARYGSGC